MTRPKKYLPTYLPTHLPYRTPSKSNPRDLWPLRHLIRVMKIHDLTKKILTYLPTYLFTYPPTHLPTYLPASFTEHPQGAIPETCDLWDTDNNSDNWEPESMTIFVIWQSIVTLDSIRNSCDVFFELNEIISSIQPNDGRSARWKVPLPTFYEPQ